MSEEQKAETEEGMRGNRTLCAAKVLCALASGGTAAAETVAEMERVGFTPEDWPDEDSRRLAGEIEDMGPEAFARAYMGKIGGYVISENVSAGSGPSAVRALTRIASADVQMGDEIPEYVPEESDPNALVYGRWLERGGSAFIVSTAGTGKSVLSVQLAMCFTEGKPFLHLWRPVRPMRVWIIQSEDSQSRLALDRAGVVAEMEEHSPGTDWARAFGRIAFVRFPGKVGAAFIDALDAALEDAERIRRAPDLVILNPLMAYIGGPIADGSYVTPFLRGGEINREYTSGMQDVIERHRCGLLVFTHTGKPPKDSEVEQWLKSPFPEYMLAGSSDLTNWGRSFVTMLKMPKCTRTVCLTAGKNGAGLGWREYYNAPRAYMAWSQGVGVDGKTRHAWRELDEDELAEATKDMMDKEHNDAETVAAALKKEAMTFSMAERARDTLGITRQRFRSAWNAVTGNFSAYGLLCKTVWTGRQSHVIYGTEDRVNDLAYRILDEFAPPK